MKRTAMLTNETVFCAKRMITYQLRLFYLHGQIVIWRMPANRGQTAFHITFIQNGSLMIRLYNFTEPANF